MEKEIIARKERRRLEETKRFRKVKRGAALVGTAMVGCSVAAPLVQPVPVNADDTPAQFGARINTSAFITEIATYAQPVAQANDLYASVMIAQAVVESGWGSSSLSQAPYHNLFGIKGSYQGQTVYMDTLEYLNNQWVSKKEPFRQYPSFAESFSDNAYVLRNTSFGNGYYYAGTWKSNTSSYMDATACLTGRYATDPTYAGKLNNIIMTYGLTKYDTPASGNAGGGATAGTSNSSTGSNTGNTANTGNTGNGVANTSSTYTVKSGDSVWGISNSFGITMDQLIEWNNIQNNFIYPGQKLTIKGGQANGSSTTNSGNNTNSSGNSNAASGAGQATGTRYTVKAGDSVWKISNDHGITMTQLIEWNNIQNNFVYPGQELVVSANGSNAGASTGGSSASTPTSNPSASTSQDRYTVKAGESVWSVSNKNGITMDQLIEWNNIKNNFIYPGQTLIVKGGNSSASTTANTTTPTAPATPNTSANTSTAATGDTMYTVKAGESVWSVANKNGITMDQLIEWNNIKNNFIYPGQQVIVKKGNTQGQAAAGAKTYTVKSGESVWSVADSHGITMDQLIEWNNIKNNFIYPGQTLIVAK
ncbi:MULTISPECIES: LysM peptidoglycan-binding domain-containing protein [unclassified Enterococcus]|uniref:muramidase family protein n=1 Tax=unclassified Enterococcus TaxID=2608891 RepID=UPI0013EACCDB|nr:MULTISPECIES: LysM peptidoglycan-binding domain-containing protein [unclassified Enterococcus]